MVLTFKWINKLSKIEKAFIFQTDNIYIFNTLSYPVYTNKY